MFQLILLMQEFMFLAKNCDPFYQNNFPHMDVVTTDIDFFFIEPRKLLNTTTMTQHWYISRLEVICLPTNLVHILYGCFAHSLVLFLWWHHGLFPPCRLHYGIVELVLILLFGSVNWNILNKNPFFFSWINPFDFQNFTVIFYITEWYLQ